METFFIFLLLAIIFIERGGNFREQIINAINTNSRGFIKYLGSSSVLSLTLSFLPYLLLSIYMRGNGFFSYEVFSDQRQAINIISINVLLNFLALSIFLFWAGLFWGLKADRVLILISLIPSIFAFLLFSWLAYTSKQYALFCSIFFLCLTLIAYIYFLCSKSFPEKARFWWIPLAFSLAFILLPIIFYENSAALTENSLMQMKVGGMDVELFESLESQSESQDAPKVPFKAKLLLRTPDFYYIRPNDNQNTVLIISTEHTSIKYIDKIKDDVVKTDQVTKK